MRGWGGGGATNEKKAVFVKLLGLVFCCRTLVAITVARLCYCVSSTYAIGPADNAVHERILAKVKILYLGTERLKTKLYPRQIDAIQGIEHLPQRRL